MDRHTRIYISCLAAVFAAAVVVGAGLDGSPVQTLAWLPLLGLAVAAEALEIGASEGSDSVLSFSATAHVAAAILFGPVVAGVLAALGVIVVDGSRLTKPRWLLANAAMFGLAATAAGVAYQLAGGSIGTVTAASGPALIAVVLVRYGANAIILCGGIALSSGRAFGPVLRERVRTDIATGIGEGSLGVLIAAGYGSGRWVILPFLVPLLAALYMSQFNFERLKRETSAALNAFAQVIDERHPTTASHTERVADYVRRFLQAIALPERETEQLIAAAQYHDLGKVVVDEATLSKVGRLSDAELQAIRRHPRLSARLLAPFHFAQQMALYTELHHERYDGRGYYRVDRSRIPIEAHVLIVADSFDAMTSVRSYRPALTTAEAADELRDKAGSQFHPLVAHAFAAMVEGEAPADALGPEQFAALRGEFARMPLVSRDSLARIPKLKVAATALTALALTAFGVPTGPTVRAALVMGAALVGCAVILDAARTRQRARRVAGLIRTGYTAQMALVAGGLDCWACWLVWDEQEDRYIPTAPPVEATAADLERACVKALRVRPQIDARLPSGRPVVITPQPIGRARLVVGCAHPPSASNRHLIDQVAGATPPATPAAPDTIRRTADAPQTHTFVVDLGLFESVRSAAGQLTAERAVSQAVSMIEQTLRATDAVVRLGDDRLGVTLTPAGPESIDEAQTRIAAAIKSVALPRRASSRPARFLPTGAEGREAA